MTTGEHNTEITVRAGRGHGSGQFLCHEIGVLLLDERLRRQDSLWAAGRVVSEHNADRLFQALKAGNGVLAGAVLDGYPDRAVSDLGEDALDWVAGLFDQQPHTHALRYDREYASQFDGYERLGPAAVAGEVAFIMAADRILVLRITDAEVLDGRTWTPTPEEDAFLQEATSTAAYRISLAHRCMEFGGLPEAVFWAVADI